MSTMSYDFDTTLTAVVNFAMAIASFPEIKLTHKPKTPQAHESGKYIYVDRIFQSYIFYNARSVVRILLLDHHWTCSK